MSNSKFPPGWDEQRVRDLMDHYDHLTEEQQVAEDEAAQDAPNETLMAVPVELVPAVRQLIARNASD